MLRSFAFVTVLSALPALAAAGDLIRKDSVHSVSETVNRLAAAVEGAGAKVFARVDHAAGAASIGSELRPVEMLMFGNPKLGTPVMAMNPAAGLDLPMRVVVYETADGKVTLAYHDPKALTAHEGVAGDAPVLGKIAGALGKLTDKAVSP